MTAPVRRPKSIDYERGWADAERDLKREQSRTHELLTEERDRLAARLAPPTPADATPDELAVWEREHEELHLLNAILSNGLDEADVRAELKREIARQTAREVAAMRRTPPTPRRPLERTDPRTVLDPDRPKPDYVLDPMVREGTLLGLVAPPGSRKSLFLMALSVAVARGDEEFADCRIPHPRQVCYVDMENTKDDYADRWRSFGLSHDDEPLARLHPLILPDLPPLDRAEGGEALLAYLDDNEFGPGDVVVLDSYQRVTEGPENDSDTARALYRHTLHPLKARGLTVLYTDNTGKDVSKGGRGTSSKRDAVDVEYLVTWEGSGGDNGYITFTNKKGRQRGTTDHLIYVHIDAGTGRTTFRDGLTPQRAEREQELNACITWLDEQGVPPRTGINKTEDACRDETGALRFKRDIIRAAIARRKEAADAFADEV